MLILVPCIGKGCRCKCRCIIYVIIMWVQTLTKFGSQTVETEHFTISLPFNFWRSRDELFTPFFNFSNSAWYCFCEWKKQRSFRKPKKTKKTKTKTKTKSNSNVKLKELDTAVASQNLAVNCTCTMYMVKLKKITYNV